MAAVYKGSLNLDKVVGVRKDNGKSYTMIKPKPSTKLPIGNRSMKTESNITSDGYKK